ncbi:NADH dehydrogenase [ubiquinone] 1 beta subcomplex subunit 5, mitochondrial-like protein [Sarcoptes scabiei]|nr:NADH dehydrogenase [ubiquinone] 1 beta subcomplex subunit 5, mitochondrial-like protein [Sarcoptes scabiei]
MLSTLRRFLSKNLSINKKQVRHSGHEHKIHIEPSNFVWNEFKDNLHFYFMLGAIPLFLLTAYAKIFVGEAELAEIPEGYTPHYWEYYKHPVTRFMAKYLLFDRSIDYEATVSKYAEDSEQKILQELKKRLKEMMAEKSDNKAWYYNNIDISQNRWIINKTLEGRFKKFGIADDKFDQFKDDDE